MAEIMLVGNPRRRGAKKRRRKMSALQRKYFGGGRASNPKRRKRRKARTAVAVKRRRRSNPSFRRSSVRRRRRNPSLRGMTTGVAPLLKAGLLGATGAIGLDILWGQASKFMPAQIAGSALAQYAAKLIGAMAVGFLGGKLLRGRGGALAAGAATVVIHDALKAQMQASLPSLPLGEYLTFAPTVGAMPRAGQFMSTGVGEYLQGLPDQDEVNAFQAGQGESGIYASDGMSGAY